MNPVRLMCKEISAKITTPEGIAGILKTLADPNRLRIFEALMRGASCNGWLTEELGLSPNLLSHHLKVLREAGLIQDRRDEVDGRWIYYQVDITALTTLHHWFGEFLDPARAVLQLNLCGPEGNAASSGNLMPQFILEEAAA
jgi:ArsR family transcriptional regulator, arsenate/arsenite/antimonite-responsive transcriptional repressor